MIAGLPDCSRQTCAGSSSPTRMSITPAVHRNPDRRSARTYTNPVEANSSWENPRGSWGNRSIKLLFSAMTTLFRAAPAEIDETVEGGFEFPVLGGLEVIRTPATPGHISLYSQATRILFAESDRLCRDKLVPSNGMFNWNEELSHRSFEIRASCILRSSAPGTVQRFAVEEKFSRFFRSR